MQYLILRISYETDAYDEISITYLFTIFIVSEIVSKRATISTYF